jgi:hypothetical protein
MIWIVLLGIASVACFSVMLVLQRPFEATLGGVLVLLCRVVYTLQNEHLTLLNTVATTLDHPSFEAESLKRLSGNADSTSDLDLTGFAGTLGIAIHGGRASRAENDCTLQRLLMHTLAKEYLRCTAALKCYVSAYGPLEPDDLVEANHSIAAVGPSTYSADALATAAPSTHTTAAIAAVAPVAYAAPADAAPAAGPVAVMDDNVAGERCEPSTPLRAALVASADADAPTPPRSPGGPPSPEQQRRMHAAAPASSSLVSTPLAAACGGSAGVGESLEDSHVVDVRQAPPTSFGLFGG